MSRGWILSIYVVVDLVIVAAVVWCVFQRIPVSRCLIPAMVLFALNGLWLVIVTVRNTPHR